MSEGESLSIFSVDVQVSNFLLNGKEGVYPKKAMARVERRVDSSVAIGVACAL